MKCPECNGEGGRIPHPENYGSYREDCVRCNGTGKQPPVDKIPVCPKCISINQCQYCGHCTKCCSTQIDKLEAENETLKTEAMRLKGRVGGLTRSNKKYKAKNEQYLSAIKAFCEASKHGDSHWKKQPYIAALFEIAGGHDEG